MLNHWDTFDFEDTNLLNQNNDTPSFQAKDDLWLKFAENISEQPEEKLTGTAGFMKDVLEEVLELPNH